jgi:hypothetical protein
VVNNEIGAEVGLVGTLLQHYRSGSLHVDHTFTHVLAELASSAVTWPALAGTVPQGCAQPALRGSGCDKTHLAAAVANAALARGKRTVFAAVPDLLDYLKATFRPSSDETHDERSRCCARPIYSCSTISARRV